MAALPRSRPRPSTPTTKARDCRCSSRWKTTTISPWRGAALRPIARPAPIGWRMSAPRTRMNTTTTEARRYRKPNDLISNRAERDAMTYVRLIAGFAFALAVSLPASVGAADMPDMSGAWSRLTFGFEPPASGPGPIGRYNNQANAGGNFNNPILMPSAAAIVKQRSEMLRSGADYPNPSLNCLPMVSPYIFRVQEFQIIQKKDEVVFLFMQDHQVRRVRMNAQHPVKLTPSWYGDSVGHYEGDTLVVDTVGTKLGPYPIVDQFGSPFTDALHVVERFQLIDYQVA